MEFYFHSKYQRNAVENILEVGIGTNFLDVPSTMGEDAIPGASLRMWRDFFPIDLNGNGFYDFIHMDWNNGLDNIWGNEDDYSLIIPTFINVLKVRTNLELLTSEVCFITR